MSDENNQAAEGAAEQSVPVEETTEATPETPSEPVAEESQPEGEVATPPVAE